MARMVEPARREIRFAVVMYGGVSLAIYINGVAQELFKMVRATARKQYATLGRPETSEYLVPDEELKGSEPVYRRLGEELKASFVVDILSGTSAGGINAVFLAKALANDQPMDLLKELWVKEGNIDLLINDKKSAAGLHGLEAPSKPNSLLNSQRMYYKLLEAMDRMETPPREPGFQSPYVGELDLFVTATDLRGLLLPIQINGETVQENRYRTVFRFHYSTESAAGVNSNDFLRPENPFLAFAARCTSSFPFAFEPMALSDTKPVIEAPDFSAHYSYKPEKWARFYKDYANLQTSFADQPFGDGGYLDNKPFSYATEALLRRRADLPVDRKLVYIEPAPEHPEEDQKPGGKPDAIANVLSALISLPRKETIREDLRLIDERNALIARVSQILQNLSPQMLQILDQKVVYWQTSGSAWAAKYLDFSVDHYGPAYAFYHQLRVADVMQNLAGTVARNLGWDENGQQAQDVLATLETCWREERYATRADGSGRKSENDLLYRLDMCYRIRRLQYLQNIIDQMLENLPGLRGVGAPPPLGLFQTSQAQLVLADEKEEAACRKQLYEIKSQLNGAYNVLRDAGRSLRQRGLCAQSTISDPALGEYARQVQALGGLLYPTSAETRKAAGDQAERISQLIFGEKGAGILGQAMYQSSRMCAQILRATPAGPQDSPEQQALLGVLNSLKALLAYFQSRYEYSDMVTYPILYASPVGEADAVDVIRISSEDARSLVDERKEQRKKLMGTRLGNFGAFFEQAWRKNDMLWGRLDGAECLINAVLPAGPARVKAVADAHKAILEEDFLPECKDALFEAAPAPADRRVTEKLLQLVTADASGALLDYFKARRLDGSFPPEQTAGLAARSSQVLGEMLKGLSSKRAYLNSPAGWILRTGQIFSMVLQAALPGSLPNFLFQNWIPRLYILALVMLVAGKPLGLGSVSQLGGLLLLILLGAHLAVGTVQGFLSGSSRRLRLLRGLLLLLAVLLGVALIALLYLGLVYLGVFAQPAGLLAALTSLLKNLLTAR